MFLQESMPPLVIFSGLFILPLLVNKKIVNSQTLLCQPITQKTPGEQGFVHRALFTFQQEGVKILCRFSCKFPLTDPILRDILRTMRAVPARYPSARSRIR